MHIRGRVRLGAALVAAALVGGLVVAGGPARAATQRLLIFTSRNVKVNDGYKMRVSVIKDLNAGTVQLMVVFVKRLGDGVQTHRYSFSLPGSSFSMNRTLTGGKIATGTKLGDYGEMNTTWSNPGDLVRRQTRCVSMRSRKGTFRGTFHFTVSGGAFDIRRSALEGTVRKIVTDTDCLGGGGGGGGQTCVAGDTYAATHLDEASDTSVFLSAFEGLGTGTVTISVVLTEGPGAAPASASHSIVVRGLPGSVLEVAANASGGTLAVPAGTPFVSGSQTLTAGFTTDSPDPNCSTSVMGIGTVQGTITLAFDVPAQAQVATGDSGWVVRQRA
ncbi:MAG TPA: hypothetical protein VNO34_05035 [Actinomycetota bacterium]|nr:hypothetical protein [Actinomycetota bacterium]